MDLLVGDSVVFKDNSKYVWDGKLWLTYLNNGSLYSGLTDSNSQMHILKTCENVYGYLGKKHIWPMFVSSKKTGIKRMFRQWIS